MPIKMIPMVIYVTRPYTISIVYIVLCTLTSNIFELCMMDDIKRVVSMCTLVEFFFFFYPKVYHCSSCCERIRLSPFKLR